MTIFTYWLNIIKIRLIFASDFQAWFRRYCSKISIILNAFCSFFSYVFLHQKSNAKRRFENWLLHAKNDDSQHAGVEIWVYLRWIDMDKWRITENDDKENVEVKKNCLSMLFLTLAGYLMSTVSSLWRLSTYWLLWVE